MGWARTAGRGTAGLLLGMLTAIPETIYVLIGTLALALPPARPGVYRGARALAEFERRRLARWFAAENGDDYTGDRALRYLGPRGVTGMVGLVVFMLIAYGGTSAAIMIGQVLTGGRVGGGDEPADWYDSITIVMLGLVLAFIAVQGLIGVAKLDLMLASRFFGLSKQEQLRRRVSELSISRAEVVEAVNDERRRIERDLHDGVQQRLVALGMLLGRARRAGDAEHAAELVRQAHEESQQALRDLREVTWRVYPTALDEGGLHPALEAVAESASVPVHLDFGLTSRPPLALETVAYFVVSEAVTNAMKHASATRIDVSVHHTGTMITVRISDDGGGGARQGGGLSGLARRVAAADGEFTVDSPVGGPTTITAELPCG
ncbi:sensor histidine kinase [Amycolatopsis sp. YIM 10]|uniref:sensor histidine kinase n=1 Tax=Amycolatopsis sp. YIM 10 TaxID=2653857 RepID=UPI00129058C1|nr:histidine kinase [Amycolatopsis sp. YIM 10]QFU94060.1 Signal transduction histidine-protein kinase/phosphatase DegS [Amycolatopsis sp. YIM 10]